MHRHARDYFSGLRDHLDFLRTLAVQVGGDLRTDRELLTRRSSRLVFLAALTLSALIAVGLVIRASKPAACCLEAGLHVADAHRVSDIHARRLTHEEFWRALRPIVHLPLLRVEEIGRSVQGRPIRAVTFGTGRTRVLLWSQMHGDESTGTMALADLLTYFATAGGDTLRDRLGQELSITMVPMLNPDGAELFQRENAMGVDLNHDARRLATPEARALKALRDRIKPAFGFNLHDQPARRTAGKGGRQVAFALLAPLTAPDRHHFSPTRLRARLVAADIVEVLAKEIPGRIARYDDDFNPRAFGDLMQRSGTSTLLIESGALPDDPQKQRLRALTVVAILSALDAIATQRYRHADPLRYERLPVNEPIENDLLVLGGRLVLGSGPPVAADLALAYDDPVARAGLQLLEVGDLRGEIALDTVDVSGLFIHPAPSMLINRGDSQWVRLRAPIAFTVRRGASRGSEVVRVFGSETR
jgi:hypothetical protein